MSRGGENEARGGPKPTPERRCIATGESGPTDRLVRFVLGPDGAVVPDLAAKLPGRGVWLTADRALVEKAVKKNLFARAFRAPAAAPEGLAGMLEELLVRRLVEVIGLARRAGQAVTGFEKVRARLKEGVAGILLQAGDGAADGRKKLARLAEAAGTEVAGDVAGDVAGGVQIVDLLDSTELGLAFGRDFAIHAALDRGGFANRAAKEASRLAGMRVNRPGESNTRRMGPMVVPGQGDR